VAGVLVLSGVACSTPVEDDTEAGAGDSTTTTVQRTTTTERPTTTQRPTTTTTRPPATTAPPPPPPTTAPPPPPPPPAPEPSGCDPNYSGCVPIASDVDCAGGSGNGPAYTGPVRVIGGDPYDLDRDGDGMACES
jgi:hypothetical protein